MHHNWLICRHITSMLCHIPAIWLRNKLSSDPIFGKKYTWLVFLPFVNLPKKLTTSGVLSLIAICNTCYIKVCLIEPYCKVVNFPVHCAAVIEIVHPQRNRFTMNVKIKEVTQTLLTTQNHLKILSPIFKSMIYSVASLKRSNCIHRLLCLNTKDLKIF